MIARHSLIILQPAGTHIVVSVNGIPLHEATMPPTEGITTTTALDHWLHPGENLIVLDVRGGYRQPTGKLLTRVYKTDTRSLAVEVEWPRDAIPPLLPGVATSAGIASKIFAVATPHETPLHETAPATSVPFEGNDLAWAPIEALHASFERGDANGVYDALEFRAREYFRLNQASEGGPEKLRSDTANRITAPYTMVPLERNVTKFEPCAGGRLVSVSRVDGAPLIAGELPGPEKSGFQIQRVFLVLSDGRYRILH